MATGIGRNTRVVGQERERITREVVERYDQGESIRHMAEDLGRSYGWVQGLLKQAGVTFRSRGGATRGAAARQRAGAAAGSSNVDTSTSGTDPRPEPVARPDAPPAPTGNPDVLAPVEPVDGLSAPVREESLGEAIAQTAEPEQKKAKGSKKSGEKSESKKSESKGSAGKKASQKSDAAKSAGKKSEGKKSEAAKSPGAKSGGKKSGDKAGVTSSTAGHASQGEKKSKGRKNHKK